MDNLSFEKYDFDTSQRSVNVQDEFMNLTPSQVRDATDVGRSPMVTVCMNLTNDFNKATIIYANENFNGGRIYLDNYNRDLSEFPVTLTTNYLDLISNLKANGYTVFAVDNIESFRPQDIYSVIFPEKSAFVYGSEGGGLSLNEIQECDSMIYIPTIGPARSLNVAQAASIVMAEYFRQTFS